MKLLKVVAMVAISILGISCSDDDDTATVVVAPEKKVELRVDASYQNSQRVLFLHNVMDDAFLFYEGQYPEFTFPTLTLALLTESGWGNDGGPPFGVPNYDEEVVEVRLGVTKDAAAIAMGYPIPVSDNELAEIDKIMIHELGHYFFSDVVKMPEGTPSSWEFMASYFALTYLNEKYQDWNMDELKQANSSDINYRTIAEFNQLYTGVGIANYDWFQRKFLTLAKSLYAVKGKALVNDFITTYKVENSDLPFIDFLKLQDNDIVENWLLDIQTSL